MLLNARPALGQSARDTLEVEVTAVHQIAGRFLSVEGRPAFFLNPAIMQREAAPGYAVGRRSSARARRLADTLGVPYVDRDKAIVCKDRS